jgi:GNAT superfamily N-acetyltransferase
MPGGGGSWNSDEAIMTNEVATTDVVARDGSTVSLRATTSDDVAALECFLAALSSESRYFRFLGIPALTTARVRALLENPAGSSMVAETAGRIVAFAGFYRDPVHADRAEVAFAVADAVQGHGIGTRLLERLAALAREQPTDSSGAPWSRRPHSVGPTRKNPFRVAFSPVVTPAERVRARFHSHPGLTLRHRVCGGRIRRVISYVAH